MGQIGYITSLGIYETVSFMELLDFVLLSDDSYGTLTYGNYKALYVNSDNNKYSVKIGKEGTWIEVHGIRYENDGLYKLYRKFENKRLERLIDGL